MAIEFFRKDGKGFAPKASVRKQGQIGLNQGAVDRFKIKDGQYVLLGYDKDRKMVAIRLIQEREKGAKKIIVKGTNGSISAKGFFDYFAIPYKKTDSYDLTKDTENNLLTFFLEPERSNEATNFEE